jgi:hypothetical protein
VRVRTAHSILGSLRQAVLSGSIVVPGDGDRLMPLVRGNVVGYDAARMTFEFTMLTPDAKMVGCTISSAALDFWAGQKGTYPAERENQFVRLRDTIEGRRQRQLSGGPNLQHEGSQHAAS